MALIKESNYNDKFIYPVKKMVSFEMFQMLVHCAIELNKISEYNDSTKRIRLIRFLMDMSKIKFGSEHGFSLMECKSFIEFFYDEIMKKVDEYNNNIK